MKATQYSFDQISHFRMLLEQKDVSPDLLQEFYDSGAIADLLEVRKPKSLDREAVRKALGLKPLNPPLLEPIGTVDIAAADRFVARKKFARNTSANIRYIGENFSTWFSDKFEEPSGSVTLCYAKLLKSSVDGPIMDELGNSKETTLAQVYALIERQKGGKPGVLLTNGWANIFYVKDATGGLRAVGVRWGASGDGWSVFASSVGYPRGWHDGDQVFSRNS